MPLHVLWQRIDACVSLICWLAGVHLENFCVSNQSETRSCAAGGPLCLAELGRVISPSTRY